MQTDMTKGKPLTMMLRFAVPLLIGNIFQQFYTMMDTVIVGKFVGTKALAAVGATGGITFLILGLLMGATNGFTVYTAQKFGAGDMKKMRETVGNAAILSLAFALVVTFVSMTGMKTLLTYMNTPEDIFRDTYTYIMIICGGITANVLYNLLASILRALGNSKTPLYFLIISATLNIFLDLAFILLFHLGVAGAALATILSQGISGVLCLIYIVRKVPELHLDREDWKFRKEIAVSQVRIGVPMGLQFSITAIGSVMVQTSLNMFGSFAVAAFTSATKVEQMFQMVFLALSSALATYNAQNIGAGKLDRVKQGFRDAHVIGVVYSALAGAALFFFGKYFSYLFISENLDQVVPMIDTFMKVTGLFFIPLYFVNALRNGIQGLGYGFLPMCAGIMELIGRGVTAVVAARKQSYIGVCLASPMAWVAASLFLAAMYVYCMRDMEKKFGKTGMSGRQTA